MDLLDRYLAAVARQLPDRQKADVTAELRDELLSKFEDEEAALGRPLERDDVERLLIDYGHPVSVAGRYRQVQHLIGPDVFPWWWATLKVVLTIVAAIYFVGLLMAILGAPGAEAAIAARLPDVTTALALSFGWVTLVFALIERFKPKRGKFKWKPRDLPPAKSRGRGRFDVLVELLMTVAVILWWIGVIRFRNWIPDYGFHVELAQVWDDWFWPILGYLVFDAAGNALTLARPGWIRLNAGLRAVRNLAGFGIMVGVLQAGHWLDVSGPWPAGEQPTVAFHFDQGMQIGLIVTAIVFAMMLIWELWRARQAFFTARAPARA